LPAYLATGQRTCHDAAGRRTPCAGSGQDPETAPGHPWPEPRFRAGEGVAADLATGLTWTLDANPAEFPLTWPEALEFVAGLNREAHLGFTDWRLPNRRELRSLVSHQTRKPALPEGHPFAGVFLGWYWSSTSAARAPAFAWYLHLEGGRMFYGRKDQSYLLWPVRGQSPVLPATGQRRCFNAAGAEIPCGGTGQDGELACGLAWPEPRFAPGRGERSGAVHDRLTGLWWQRRADAAGGPVRWAEALEAARGLGPGPGGRPWRLPTINELESVVDAGRHDPALPAGHPFTGAAEAYWSSTTSLFEPDWAWALYLHKGACGVGQKKDPHFHVWAVSG
jgi:hypothetical protein